MEETKFCKHCGQKIAADAVLCIHCGRQVEKLQDSQPAAAPVMPSIVINNDNSNTNTNSSVNQNTNIAGGLGLAGFGESGTPKNKWVAFLLCLCFGYFGLHKFYEGKKVMGIIYIFTCGLCMIGWVWDCIVLWKKPNPYYV